MNKKRYWLRGLIIGFVIGALLGFVLGLIFIDANGDTGLERFVMDPIDSTKEIIAFAVWSAILGLVIGWIYDKVNKTG